MKDIASNEINPEKKKAQIEHLKTTYIDSDTDEFTKKRLSKFVSMAEKIDEVPISQKEAKEKLDSSKYFNPDQKNLLNEMIDSMDPNQEPQEKVLQRRKKLSEGIEESKGKVKSKEGVNILNKLKPKTEKFKDANKILKDAVKSSQNQVLDEAAKNVAIFDDANKMLSETNPAIRKKLVNDFEEKYLSSNSAKILKDTKADEDLKKSAKDMADIAKVIDDEPISSREASKLLEDSKKSMSNEEVEILKKVVPNANPSVNEDKNRIKKEKESRKKINKERAELADERQKTKWNKSPKRNIKGFGKRIKNAMKKASRSSMIKGVVAASNLANQVIGENMNYRVLVPGNKY